MDDHSPLIFVCNFDVMNPNVCAPDVDAVQATLVATADDHVVYFAIGGCVQSEVKRRCINQSNVVNAEIDDLMNTLAQKVVVHKAILTFLIVKMLGLRNN
jgi:hypothetical protein